MTETELNALLGLETAIKPPFYLAPIEHTVEIIMPSSFDVAPPSKPAPKPAYANSFVTKNPQARYVGRQVYSGGNVVLGPLTDRRIAHYANKGRYGPEFKAGLKASREEKHRATYKTKPKNVKQSVTSLLESLGLG